MTQEELVTQARSWAEGEDSDRWSDDEILLFADLVFRREWAGILRLNPDFRTGTRTVTPSSSGVFPLTDLNSGSGDSAERLFRVRTLAVGDIYYEPLDIHERPMDTSYPVYGWYRNGNNIQLLPAASTEATVVVSHLPTKPSDLAGVGSTVTFVDDYEQILALETAALMLSKGGTETDAARDLKETAMAFREEMLTEISNLSSRPPGFAYDDSAEAWGGQ